MYMMPRHVEFTLDYFMPYLVNSVRIAALLLFAWAASYASKRGIRGLRAWAVRRMLTGGSITEMELEKRVQTIGQVVGRAINILIWALAITMALREMNFNIGPLLAGAGIVGVAVGLGAQSMIRDVLNGMFLLIENQIRINDVVVINGTGGLVEEINLRTTVLRGENGAVHIFPNGSITTLSNLTREFSYAVFNVTVGYGEDLDRVMAVIVELGAEMRREDAWKDSILQTLEMLGVDALADSGAVIKFRFRTVPMKQWGVAREMNRRLKSRFEQDGIDTPYPTRTIQLAASPALRDEIRQAVREVLAEQPRK